MAAMRRRLNSRLLVLGISVFLLADAEAQTSRCADCHIANEQTAAPQWSGFALRHLHDWESSAHSRANVGCDKCHGGDPTTFEKFQAHMNMLPVTSPASPVNRVNLPRTCGACHSGPFVAFQKSKHYELARAGDDRGPTCSTCHGEVAAYLLSPNSLANQCARCHGSGRPQARPDYPASARMLLTDIRELRSELRDANAIIRRIRDKSIRAKFEEARQQAEVPLVEATQAGHEFVFDNLKERLEAARRRVNALMDALANGTP
jgi:hypothetical protein